MDAPAFTYRPIGVVRSPYAKRIDAPHQPTVVVGTETGAPAEATLELVASLPESVLRDLAGFERIWLIFAFHLSDGWAPLVQPPRGPRAKRGVLATRSPHRPNAIGLSAVELVAVEGRTLRLRGVDLLGAVDPDDVGTHVRQQHSCERPRSDTGQFDDLDSCKRSHGEKPTRRKMGLSN